MILPPHLHVRALRGVRHDEEPEHEDCRHADFAAHRGRSDADRRVELQDGEEGWCRRTELLFLAM